MPLAVHSDSTVAVTGNLKFKLGQHWTELQDPALLLTGQAGLELTVNSPAVGLSVLGGSKLRINSATGKFVLIFLQSRLVTASGFYLVSMNSYCRL
jgi:hypothetical protein